MAGQHYKSKETASFKCAIYYTDGSIGVYYSRDYKNDRFRPDLGLAALNALVAASGDRVKDAMIWDKRCGRDRLVRKCKSFRQGWIVNLPVDFELV